MRGSVEREYRVSRMTVVQSKTARGVRAIRPRTLSVEEFWQKGAQ